MDDRIEAFLREVLNLEGQNPNSVREGMRMSLARYEKQFRDAEPDERMKDEAAKSCRARCADRVREEISRQREGPTADHLKRVLHLIEDDPAVRFPLRWD